MITTEEIALQAQRLRDVGFPDELNRWLTMTPERFEEHEAAKAKMIDNLRRDTTMPKTTPAAAPALDFTAHKHPCLAVACPTCHAGVGVWCKRPSGHKAMMSLHADRLQAADAAWEAAGLPPITQTGPGKYVYDGEPSQPPAQEPAQPAAEAAKETIVKTKSKSAKKSTSKKNAPKTKASSKPAPSGGVRGSKVGAVLDLLQRKEGCTMADVTAATGWKTMSFPQMAKAAGITLKQKKDGKVTRYWDAATAPKESDQAS